MKRTLICLATLACSAATADAADLPLKTTPLVAAPSPGWTGFYAGVQGGYEWGRDRTVEFGFGGCRPDSITASARRAGSVASMRATIINSTGLWSASKAMRISAG